jgi:poly(3-hydroxybutyrate) depolymerase
MGHGYTDIPIPPGCGVPPVSRRGVDAAFETATAAVTGLTDYWTTALLQARSPVEVALDGLRWWEIMTERRRPRWATRHRIVRRTPLTRLRDFTPADAADVVPTLVLPPQAGHDSCIVDFSTEQSQMRTIRAVGLERLYALEWVGATPATKDATIADELAEVAAAVDHIGGPVNLVGDCQGGWLATIYAALHPERINTLTIAGAPIDFRAGDAVIHAYVQALGPDMGFYERVIAMGDGVLKGEFMLNGFIAIKPENEVAKQLQLLNRIRDDEHVARHRAFEDWFKHTQDIPGDFYLWIVERLFRDNALINGGLEVEGRCVDLAAIRCPLYLLAGATDHITPPAQVFALADAVSTPAEDIVERVTGGGHLGLFMGREALRDHWPVIIERIQADSRPEHRAHARAATPPVRTPVPAP